MFLEIRENYIGRSVAPGSFSKKHCIREASAQVGWRKHKERVVTLGWEKAEGLGRGPSTMEKTTQIPFIFC